MTDDPLIIRQMEQLGTEMVRAEIANGRWPAHLMDTARRWLHAKDQESRERSDDSQASQARIALSAKKAAWIAAIAAISAVPLAIIAIIISYLSWKYPR